MLALAARAARAWVDACLPVKHHYPSLASTRASSRSSSPFSSRALSWASSRSSSQASSRSRSHSPPRPPLPPPPSVLEGSLEPSQTRRSSSIGGEATVTNPAGSSPGLHVSIEVDRVSWISSLALLVLLAIGWMLACR
jgi:hypothetical protein